MSSDIGNKLANKELLQRRQMELDSLLEVIKAISTNESEEHLYKMYAFILRAEVGFDTITVFYKSDQWEKTFSMGEQQDGLLILDERWLDYKDIIHISDIDNTEAYSFMELLVPVYHKAEALAFVLLGRSKIDKLFHDEQLRFIKTLTYIIIIAIENKYLFKRQLAQERFKQEIAMAEKVQSMLIPKKLPNNREMLFDAFYIPHYNISGDYYDVIAINEAETLVCIADVSGKGIGAAMIMSNLQAMMHVYAKENLPLTELVQKLNRHIFDITDGEAYITLFVAVYNAESRSLHYLNAGHYPPLLIVHNRVKELTQGCYMLGSFKQIEKIDSEIISISENSHLLLFTDGLTDLTNENGEILSEELLRKYVLKILSNENREVPFSQKLLKYLYTFKGNEPFTDDISVLYWHIF
ncbi:MAG: SpoIIE family protein phosphatase [Chitinophagales bacterium]|nr:SpoIIE family protein phosphatase [Bacteroidota bacterium]MCB9043247.1 SpoIIE family protein phosphatase [Chitinophagales bacterium]